MNKILILGVGNLLMQDEGVGVHAAQALAQENITGVDVLDGGTGGFHLLEYFENYPTLILIDATLDGAEPGTITLRTPQYASDFPQSMSTHDIGLRDLLTSIQLLGKMPNVYLFTMSIATIQELDVSLSPLIQSHMPALLKQVRTLAIELSNQ